MALEEWKLRLTSAKVAVEFDVEAELGNLRGNWKYSPFLPVEGEILDVFDTFPDLFLIS